jgi:hypothetical protein
MLVVPVLFRMFGRAPARARSNTCAGGRRSGQTHLVLSPLAFLRRLAALVPPPRANLVRYFGVFAPNARLRPNLGGVEFDPDNWRPQGLLEYSAMCAWALALAHAKSGDAAMIAGYAGKSEALDDALTGFAFAYADQTERDHAALEKAARTKRIPVAKVS